MTTSRLILVLWFALAGVLVRAADQPYLAEAKVMADLDSALSRVIPKGKYVIQVDAEVATRSERRVVESEKVTTGVEKEDEEEPPREYMPGFLPEPSMAKKKPEKTAQNREVFRMVETPVLNLVRVHVTLDEKLEPEIITKTKLMVASYLTSAYPNKHTVKFTQIPMLKTRDEIEIEKENLKKQMEEELKRQIAMHAPSPTPAPIEKVEEKKDPLKEYLPWAAAGVLALMLFISMLLPRRSKSEPAPYPSAPQPWTGVPPFTQYPSQGPFDARGHFARERAQEENDEEEAEEKEEGSITRAVRRAYPVDENLDFTGRRRRFLDTIFSQSDTYRMYLVTLPAEHRDELYAMLKGPAYEKFLDGIGVKRPAEEVQDPQDMEERLTYHEKAFQEFSKAKDWQDRQFFGFLQRLNEEQIMTLVHHEDPFSVCVMLRFMKPSQSALVLDALPQQRRVEVLKYVNEVQRTSFHELTALEQHIRTSVNKLPEHFFGSKKEDITYWSRVLDEAQDQDGILHDLEHTQPEIFPDLAKTRFKLDEAVNVAPEVLKKVLGEADNEELALALLSCNANIQAFILGKMSPRRKALLEEQLATSRGAAKDQIVEARLKLTKRFREALG